MTNIRIRGYQGWEERLEWCVEHMGPWIPSYSQPKLMYGNSRWAMVWKGNPDGSGNYEWIFHIEDDKLATMFILRWV